MLPRLHIRLVCASSGGSQTGLCYLGGTSDWFGLPRLQVSLVGATSVASQAGLCTTPQTAGRYLLGYALGIRGMGVCWGCDGGGGTRAVGFVFKKKGP